VLLYAALAQFGLFLTEPQQIWGAGGDLLPPVEEPGFVLNAYFIGTQRQ